MTWHSCEVQWKVASWVKTKKHGLRHNDTMNLFPYKVRKVSKNAVIYTIQ